MDNSSPHISNSTFINNISDKGDGAAIYSNNSNPKINNSSFSLNSVKDGGKGGAIYNKSSNPSISNCLFSSNLAEFDFGTYNGEGGAIYNDNSNPNISNSVFVKNISNNNGGAIYNNNSKPKIHNSILWNNEKRRSAKNWLRQNIFNKDDNSQADIKYSILNASSVNGKNATIDTTTGAGKGNNKTPATFAIDKDGKVASASQNLIKNKGDNSLYLKVYDLIRGTAGTTQIPATDKDLAHKARLKDSKIDIGAYEIQN